MSDIVVTLPDNLGSITFPEGTSKAVIEKEASNAYLRARGSVKGRSDAKGKSDGTAQAFGGGVLQGFGDEATAAIRSALPEFSNWMMRGPSIPTTEGMPQPQTVSDAPSFEGRYEEELARERSKRSTFAKDNPATAMTANVFGSIAPFIPAGIAGLPIAPAMGPSFFGNLGKAALTGGLYGGLMGFGEGEGGFDNRLDSSGTGAAFGAAAGPAVMLAGQGGRAVMDYAKTTRPGQAALGAVQGVADTLERFGSVKPKSLSAAAPDNLVPGDNPLTYAADQIRSGIASPEQALKQRAAQQIATAVERGKMTAAQAKAELAKLGEDGMLVDVNKALMRKGRMTNTLEGETSDLAEKVLDARAAKYNPRLRSTIEGQNPPPDDVFFRGEFPGTGNIFQQNASQVGARAYQDEMTKAGLKQSPDVLRLLANPQIEGAMDRVMASLSAARQGTNRQPESPVEVMHMIKREIQGIGLDANGRPSSTAYQWQQTANEFVDALKKANPKLAEADVLYAKAKSLPEFYEQGLGVFDKGSKTEAGMMKTGPAFENLLKAADVAQANATQFGAINAGRAVTGGVDADAIALARRIKQSDDVRRKITAAFPDEHAQRIFDAAETVLRFEKTRRGTLGGSQTADKTAEVLGGGLDTSLSVRAAPGSFIPRFIENVGDVARRVMAPNEPVRNEMGRMLFSPDPMTNEQTLALVQEILRQRASQRQGAAVWGGLAGGYGGAAQGGNR